MSSNLFTPKLRYTNKDTCNSAWTFIDGQNVSDIEVPQFIKNLFTSFDDSRYGKMGKDLIEGTAPGGDSDHPNLCVLPTTPVDGYVIGNMACTSLTTDSITCETNPTCAEGYTGHPESTDHSCLAEGDELTIGGCTIQTCDVSEVTAPANGHFGTNCADDSTTINHGTECDLTCDAGYTLSAQPTCNEGTLTSTTATCTANTCRPPTTPVDGYNLTGVACSNLQTGSITCETNPTCAGGYTGNPTETDYRCDGDGEELTIGGCSETEDETEQNICVDFTTSKKCNDYWLGDTLTTLQYGDDGIDQFYIKKVTPGPGSSDTCGDNEPCFKTCCEARPDTDTMHYFTWMMYQSGMWPLDASTGTE